MDRAQQVRRQRMALCVRRHAYWKAFQLDAPELRRSSFNRDGTISRPRFAKITPEQEARFEAREHRRVVFESPSNAALRIGLERKMGATLDFVDLPPDQQAMKAGRPVVRIVSLPEDGLEPEGIASGFLIGPGLILTNHHVFGTREDAAGLGAQFLYEREREGRLRSGEIFRFEPARFFVTDAELDYAIVAIGARSLEDTDLDAFQFLPLIEAKGKILKGDPVNIIQYPDGGPKMYATVNNHLIELRDDGTLLYDTDTLEGSSGSPVFNRHWETIGLHRCGIPEMKDDQFVAIDGHLIDPEGDVNDSDIRWIANEGTRVSALIESLRKQEPERPDERRALDQLLGTTGDPLLLVESEAPQPSIPTLSIPIARQEADMSTLHFEFHGPVTIQIGTGALETAGVSLLANRGSSNGDAGVRDEAPEKVLRFDPHYETRKGYDSKFLKGHTLALPTLDAHHLGEPLRDEHGKVWVIPYHHYSLVMNRTRRLLSWAASNVDYSPAARKKTKTRKEYGGENWRLDPRVATQAPGLQIEDEHFYDPAKKIDRGHIVRREDGCWGLSAKDAEFGNSDTYHWTNCTPQSQGFNQSSQKGLWGKFEEYLERQIKTVGGRMTIFAGPVLKPEDPTHGYEHQDPIQVPMEFWKVVVCVVEEHGQPQLQSYGLVFDQTDAIKKFGYEKLDLGTYVIQQHPIEDITQKTGVVFDPKVVAADVLKHGPGDESLRVAVTHRIRTLEDVILR